MGNHSDIGKTYTNSGEDILTSEKHALDLREDIPTSEKYALDLGEDIPTSEKRAPDSGHVFVPYA